MQQVVRIMLVASCLPITTAVERHFNFSVAMRLTMEYGMNCNALGQHCEPSFRAYECENGKLCYHNSSSNTGAVGIELPVPPSANVLVTDGKCRLFNAEEA